MWSFFQNSVEALPDFSVLGLDMHSHLLPGIDDGALHIGQSLDLIAGMQNIGYQHFITTPHVMSGVYPNTRSIILRQEEQLREALEDLGSTVGFSAAAEYYLDETFATLIEKEPLLTLPGNRVLIEMSSRQPYPDLHNLLFSLQMKGYQPIMAHPERYPYYKKLEDYEHLIEMGCVLQVNILSLSGYYGKRIQSAASMISEARLVTFLGSDLHQPSHVDYLKAALKHPALVQAIASNPLENRRVLENLDTH